MTTFLHCFLWVLSFYGCHQAAGNRWLLCRSRMDVRVANTKFLEGMMVISYVREMWDLSKLHVGEVNSSTTHWLGPRALRVSLIGRLCFCCSVGIGRSALSSTCWLAHSDAAAAAGRIVILITSSSPTFYRCVGWCTILTNTDGFSPCLIPGSRCCIF